MDGLQALRDSEINFGLSSVWGQRVEWSIFSSFSEGEILENGEAESIDGAVAGLCAAAIRVFPESDFALICNINEDDKEA